jgi:hypothetical protein
MKPTTLICVYTLGSRAGDHPPWMTSMGRNYSSLGHAPTWLSVSLRVVIRHTGRPARGVQSRHTANAKVGSSTEGALFTRGWAGKALCSGLFHCTCPPPMSRLAPVFPCGGSHMGGSLLLA